SDRWRSYGNRTLNGQDKDEARAMGIVALHPKPAAMRLHNGARDGQAHPHTVLLSRKEGVEDLVGVLKTWPGITHLDPNGVAISGGTHSEQSLSLIYCYTLHGVAHV